MTIRKLAALFTALIVLCLSCTALAETVSVGDSGLKLTLPEYMISEALTAEDIADDMVAYYYNDDMDLVFYQYDAEGVTLAEVLESVQDDESLSQFGSTTINDIEFVYMVGEETDDEGTYVYIDYVTVVNGNIVEILFFFDDTSVSQKTADVMNTITK